MRMIFGFLLGFSAAFTLMSFSTIHLYHTPDGNVKSCRFSIGGIDMRLDYTFKPNSVETDKEDL